MVENELKIVGVTENGMPMVSIPENLQGKIKHMQVFSIGNEDFYMKDVEMVAIHPQVIEQERIRSNIIERFYKDLLRKA